MKREKEKSKNLNIFKKKQKDIVYVEKDIIFKSNDNDQNKDDFDMSR